MSSEGRVRELAEYARVLANTVGLVDWEIEIERDESLDDDTYARVHYPRGRRRATVTLGPEFFKSKPREQRATLVHELVHCHFAHAGHFVDETLPLLLGKPAFSVFQGGLELAMEDGIDAIAVSLAELVPLPPEEE